MLPKALKSCPKSNKLPNLVTLLKTKNLYFFVGPLLWRLQKTVKHRTLEHFNGENNYTKWLLIIQHNVLADVILKTTQHTFCCTDGKSFYLVISIKNRNKEFFKTLVQTSWRPQQRLRRARSLQIIEIFRFLLQWTAIVAGCIAADSKLVWMSLRDHCPASPWYLWLVGIVSYQTF